MALLSKSRRISNIWLLAFVLLLVNSCKAQKQGRLTLGKGGEIEKGRVKIVCSPPSKRYAKSIDAAVKGAFKALDTASGANLTASVKTEVVRLSDYSQQGLDLDLILFRLCQMGNNRLLDTGQINQLFKTAVSTWTSRMTIKEQKSVIAQLAVELSSNLKTANELKQNTQTILSVLNLVSGDAILRNSKIKILPLLFPKENLDTGSKKSVHDLVEEGVTKYVDLHLDTNQLEKQKFSEAGKTIALTLDKTIPTLKSLADSSVSRYPVYTTIWNANAQNLSKIDVFDVTRFQQTYADLNSLRASYNIVVGRSIDYLNDLNQFFKPSQNLITRGSLEKMLTSERLAYDLIGTYSKNILSEIEDLAKLQQLVEEALR